MKLTYIFFVFLLLTSCTNFGQLHRINTLPDTLIEVSGTEKTINSNLIWMLNDSGNASKIYGMSKKGKLKKVLKINAKNHDWEDLTSDSLGNLYIADFGNNKNKRKNLVILKVDAHDLNSTKKIDVERISFEYPDQKKFPPKKSNYEFDAESLFWYNNYLYIFTKSRIKKNFGKTNLYKIPASSGHHIAEFIASYSFGSNLNCWITSADISVDKNKVVLLNHESVWLLTDFTNDNFFNGKITQYPLNHISQKEGLCFKDEETLYITDEKSHGKGGNLYKLSLKKN